VAFEVNGGEAPGIYWQPADGSVGAERLTAAAEGTLHHVRSWSPDGRILAFTESRNGDAGIWTLEPASGNEPVLFYDLQASQQYESAFSPDGRWLAYTSSESGRDELYMQPFPATGAKHRLTHESGTFPLWSPDGRHLYYRRTFQQVNASARMQLLALPIAAQRAVQVGTERALGIEGFLAFRSYQDYDIMPDDARFLLVLPAEGRVRAPRIHIVQNWFEELRDRARASSSE
jgi:serine/threonine-protein kinase